MLRLPSSDSWVWLVLSTLAVWRLTALVCYDRGPFNLLTLVRRALVQLGLQRVVTCFHCAAVWMSMAVILALFEWRALTAILVLAVAGAASLVERWLGVVVEDEHGS